MADEVKIPISLPGAGQAAQDARPLPELASLLKAASALTKNEQLEAHFDGVARDIGKWDEALTQIILRRGELAERLNRVRTSQPLTVLVACMQACPMDGAEPTECALWEMHTANMVRLASLLTRFVRDHKPGGMLRW